ncbi:MULTISPECIES: sugar nucleotide-binding protein [unclassified Herbaspirillum]|uniref:SDR family oxidoreductase n=1 Tax=unclassified Herbaspirillum TaxID=2624150 RepID=UPI00161C5F64|nr:MULTISPECIES: sugar nucleotide-binding protein [unclassified Herbaspirillum]
MSTVGHLPRSVLITGAEGGIASGLAAAFTAAGIPMWLTTRRHDCVSPRCLFMDLSESIEHWQGPPAPVDVAFLCAAITSQAQCESQSAATARVNVTNTVQLARKLAATGTFVVFVSTNLVLDGETPFANTDHPYNPQTVYGRQKAEAERQLLNLDQQVAIVRVGKVIVPGMPLFENWADDLRSGKRITPYHDLIMAPISLSFAVEVLRRVAQQRRPGILHATAARDMSYAEAALEIARKLGADPTLVEPVSHLQSVFAPRYAALDTAGLASVSLRAPQPEQAFDHFAVSDVAKEVK